MIVDRKWTWKHGWVFAVAKSKVFLPLQWKKRLVKTGNILTLFALFLFL